MKSDYLKRIFNSGMRGKLWRNFLIIIIIAGLVAIVDSPRTYNKGVNWISEKTSISLPLVKERSFSLGLDLQGGSHLVYQADVANLSPKDREIAVEGVRDVIERRVNVFGVSEPIVQVNKTAGGDYRIIVELAGIKDVNEAIKMIGETPLLEFKELVVEKRDLTEEEKTLMSETNQKAEEKAEEVLGKVLSGGDFASLAKEYSEDEDTKVNGGDLGWIVEDANPEIINIAKNLEAGKVTQDINKVSNGLEIVKLDEKRAKKDPFTDKEEREVKASHILICHEEAEKCENPVSKDEAYSKIKELKDRATIDNFADLAKEFSTGPSGPNGGGLGWFGKGQMVKPFEDTVFEQSVGSVSYIVETMFGYHLIYKQDERSIYEYKVSHIFIGIMSEQDILGPEEDWKNTELTGKYLDRATVQFNPNDSSPEVSLEFDSEGSDLFEEITGRNVGKQVAIFLDNYIISAPTVNEKISGGRAVVSGKFNLNEARLLAQRLNAGALPVPIALVSQKTVGATLGKASVDSSLKSGMYGLMVVAIFMLLYYRLPGLLAVFSLGIYGLLVLAIFKLWPVTLSLAGLAGFILSIGMAVDANVLIFERLREELRSNKPITKAINDGFKRAWPSIRDGNFSTIITSIILIMFTTSIVKGFALTLILGILVSMFSAIVITKNFLLLVSGDWLENNKWLIGIKK